MCLKPWNEQKTGIFQTNLVFFFPKFSFLTILDTLESYVGKGKAMMPKTGRLWGSGQDSPLFNADAQL